ncbi:MAG: ABC transporter substrate-binding protein [Nocardioides sp.]
MTHSARVSSSARIAVAVVVVLLLTACGSSLEPEEVALARGSSTVVAPSTVGGADPSDALLGANPEAGPASSIETDSIPATPAGSALAGSDAAIPGDGSKPVVADSTEDGGDVESPTDSEGSEVEGPTGRGVAEGSCEGFQNGVGISDDTILIGNASDISGPIPGLFQQTQDALDAYVAYFNATNDICGRKLEVKAYDSRTDASADQQVYTQACTEVFAMVSSASAFDSGGAKAAQDCGLPDLRTNSLTRARNECTTCFGVNSTDAGQFENIVPDTIIKDYGGGQRAAMLYINAGAAAENGITQAKAGTKRGMKYVYQSGIDIAEFNYAPFVRRLIDNDVESLQFVANDSTFVRMAMAMQQQNYKPEVWMLDPSAYTPAFVETGGDAVEGVVVFMNFTPFEEAASNPELSLYLAWLSQVNPNAKPGFFGVFAWSAARLFVETSLRLGGRLSRQSLVDAIRKVDDWSGNDIHAPQHVGPKQVSDCWRFIKLVRGEWIPVGGRAYRCAGVTTVG